MSVVKPFSIALCAITLIFIFCSKNPVDQQTGENRGGEVSFLFVASAESDFGKLAYRAEARVTAPDMDTIIDTLTVGTLTISGTISNIPAGFNRKFEVIVYTDSNTICYYGKTYMDIIANITNKVSLTLYRYSGTGSADITGTIVDSIPSVTNIPPSVKLTSPAEGMDFKKGDTVFVTAIASDADGKVTSVLFYNGTTLLSTVSDTPYTYTIINGEVGSYSLFCVAIDDSGDSSISNTVNFKISSHPNISPTVKIISPADGSTLKKGDTIRVVANASDVDGKISSVLFYQAPDILLARDTVEPYEYVFPSNAEGNFTLYCVAFDDSGANTYSEPVSFAIVDLTNIPPTVTITSPADSTQFYTGDDITITVSASDTDGTISRVVFYNGNTLLGVDTAAPYSFLISSAAAGLYNLKCVAFDNMGDSGVSSTVVVTVKDSVIANIAPTVTITSPADSALFYTGDDITITASASDTDGTISRVAFYNGSTLLGIVNAAPYTFLISNAAAGLYNLKCVAFDNMGDSGVSSTVVVTVKDSVIANIAPTVEITSPADSAQFNEGDDITITASASDSDGTISRVVFYNGAELLGIVTVAPYTYTITDAQKGIYSFKCVAFDNSGDSAVSDIVNVIVNGEVSLLEKYGVPTAEPLPSIVKNFTSIVTEGTGAPSMSQVNHIAFNWDLQNKGLYDFGMRTADGNPSWYVGFLPLVKHTFGDTNPGCTITGSGFTGFDGEYYITMDGANLVLVEKTGKYAVIFQP